MGSWVGAIAWIANVGEDVVKSIGFNQVSINGQVVNIANGGKRVLSTHGASVIMNGNKVTIAAPGESVDFISYGYFFNQFVTSRVLSKIYGICAGEMLASGEFRNGAVNPKIIHLKHKHCPKRKAYFSWCKRKGFQGVKLKNCIFDLCAGTKKDVEKHIIRMV